MNSIGILIFLVGLSTGAEADASSKFNDVRCRCTCKPSIIENIPRKVYIKNVTQDECNCLSIVSPANVINATCTSDYGSFLQQYCLGCQCKFEVRSMKTMEVVVIMYISLIILLFLYMIISGIIEVASRKRRFEAEPDRELLVTTTTDTESLPRQHRREHTLSSSVVMQRLSTVQTEWRRQLQSQREKVFGKRNVLQ